MASPMVNQSRRKARYPNLLTMFKNYGNFFPTMRANKNKVAIITGAGAVENSWTPILTILRMMMPGEVDEDVANCFFAKHIYLLRAYSKNSHEKSVANLREEIELIKELKDLICDSIKLAEKRGILKARKEFKTILSKFVFTQPNTEFGLVSTNWDTTIDREANEIVKGVYIDLKSCSCFHLHGSVDVPDHIYLPSETSHENYRSDEECNKHGYNHYATLKFLEQANQIVLYGLSLDPLDAELSQILGSTFDTSSNLKEIIIVNPDYNRVRNRVRALLFKKPHIKIRCLIPENLENEV
jgi:hypothetical protein